MKHYPHEIRQTSDLIPYANNSRMHSDEQVNQIASSIKEFGFTSPILIDEQGGVIAGHGRIMAASKLSMDELPCITLEGLTEAQKKAYVIADNKIALNADWDMDTLKIEIETLQELLFDIDLIGFDSDEFVFTEMPDFEPATEDEQGKLDKLDPIYVICPKCGTEFDTREA